MHSSAPGEKSVCSGFTTVLCITVTVGWGCVLFTLTAMADGIGARVAVDVARAQTQLRSAASRSSTTSALTC